MKIFCEQNDRLFYWPQKHKEEKSCTKNFIFFDNVIR